jgi:hypothetical protein
MSAKQLTVIGLDIGDGESALASLDLTKGEVATGTAGIFTRPVTKERSVITAMARASGSHRRLIGEEAVAATGAIQFSVNFKHAPDPYDLGTPDPVLFAQTLLSEFFRHTGKSMQNSIVYIGHPAGWPAEAVETYRAHFASNNLTVRLMPESQSALVHVRDRQAGRAGRLGRVLVIDIGSSTTDCTMVEDMEPRNLDLGADLGCQQIDRELQDLVIAALKEPDFVTALGIDGGRDLLLLACRRVKEAYFTKTKPKMLALGGPLDQRFNPIIDKAFGWLTAVDIADVIDSPGGWAERYRDLLTAVSQQIGVDPELIVLTGGGSRMTFVRVLTQQVFPTAEIEDDPEPSFSVVRGLASNGRHRFNVEAFREEIAAIADDPAIPVVVNEAIDNIVAVLKEELERLSKDNPKSAIEAAQNLAARSTEPDSAKVAQLNEALAAALSSRVLDTCRKYGAEDQAITFTPDLPHFTSDIVKMASSRATPAAMPPQAAEHGIKAIKWAWQKATNRPVKRAEEFAVMGVVFLGAIAYALWRDNQQGKAVPHLDTAAIKVTPEERERFVAGVRESIATQLSARAEAIERFLA